MSMQATLAAHARWLRGENGGVCADLSDADLSDADLSDAVLSGADLQGVRVTGGMWTDGWPWLTGLRYDAAMLSPGSVRIGCTELPIDGWLGAAGHERAIEEGVAGSLEHQTLVQWLLMLDGVADWRDHGWVPA